MVKRVHLYSKMSPSTDRAHVHHASHVHVACHDNVNEKRERTLNDYVWQVLGNMVIRMLLARGLNIQFWLTNPPARLQALDLFAMQVISWQYTTQDFLFEPDFLFHGRECLR